MKLPDPKTFKNPLRQFLYDNHLTMREACDFLKINNAQLPALLNEDPEALKHTRLLTLKRIRDLSGVDLIAWYLGASETI